ncbi:hypothetical protein PINS_up002300 [Pythium insidiosum]|nr:hypothetical protein PINS_up002300 [Pythium insidiosum]
MNDIYAELEQHAKDGRMRLPAKFVDFHRTDVMYAFTRAAVGYALAFVRVRTTERETEEQRHTDTSTLSSSPSPSRPSLHALNQHTAVSMPAVVPSTATERFDLERQNRLNDVRAQQVACAKALGETYARLVLHCSNFEHHKEDEHVFECIYFFVCSVVKVGLAPEHWRSIESELAFLFRGAQFSSNVRLHASESATVEKIFGVGAGGAILSTAGASATAASVASSGGSTTNSAMTAASTGSAGVLSATSGGAGGGAVAAAGSTETTPTKSKIQQLSPHGSIVNTVHNGGAGAFVLPPASSPRCRYFPESFPVHKIVSELDAVKFRAARNIEASQHMRERIAESHASRRIVRRPSDVVAPPDREDERSALAASPIQSPRQPRRRCVDALQSPRLSMKSMFTARSPALNHLLPTPDDRVRIALECVSQWTERSIRVTGCLTD